MRILVPAILLGTLAAPAHAQAPAPFCGGISLVGEWVGGDEAASDAMAPEAFFELDGQVPIAGHLVRMFTLSEPGEVRIDVDAVPAGDPYIALYDRGGNEVGADDDGGVDFGSSLTRALSAGTYCLAARSYESGVTDVAVRIGRPDFFPQDPPPPSIPAPVAEGAGCGAPDVALFSDAQITPAMLAEGVSVEGAAARIPAIALSLADAAPLTITATSDEADPLIRLLDGDGEVLAEDDDSDGLNSRIQMREALAPGTYCIELEDLNASDAPIVVALDAFDPAADRLRRLGLMEFAPGPSDAVAPEDLGTLATAITTDVAGGTAAAWLRFDLPEGGLILIEAVGFDVDPEIKLFDRLGREVAYNDDGPDGLDSFLVHRAQAGAYILGVRAIDEAPAGDIRILLERYVAAE